MEKTFIIKSRGRKYFTCKMGRCQAKLIINEVSTDLQPERIVRAEVNDLSTKSKYGSDLKFEPIAIIEARDGKAAYQAAVKRNEAEKWLGYAEGDAAKGWDHSNAIGKALQLAADLPELAERAQALRDKIAENRAANDAAKAARESERTRAKSMRRLYPGSQIPALDVPLRLWDKVVVFTGYGRSFQISEEHPSVAGSHLLGYEGDYGCYCYYREATADEIAGLEASEAQAQATREAAQAKKQALQEIRALIMAEGEQPIGNNTPEGERVHDSQDIYGGGDWFVIGPEYIWYVKNNGRDGDDWAYNNVRTGGAGAIGWRVDYRQELADKLQSLEG
jgi:hypothetical protein